MIKVNTSNSSISQQEYDSVCDTTLSAYKTLMERSGEGSEMLGWLDLPSTYDKEEFERIKKAADKIKNQSQVLIAIGIGGSYLGARAGIEFTQGQFCNDLDAPNDGVSVIFAGNNISSKYITDVIKLIGDRDFSVNVISKSGTTTEPAVAFRIFKNLLEAKYGDDGARERIYATTDANKGALHDLAIDMGYERFVVPDATGGRFSVLTAVGLLPMAAAGMDIDKVMQGAKDAMDKYNDDNFATNDVMKYAASRYIFYTGKSSAGKKDTEILANYEPSLTMFGEWYKQLFAESEGKDKKGLFPASASFSTDLHSIGQFIQDGTRNLFETVIWVEESQEDIDVPYDAENIDGLNFAAGKTMQYVNSKAMQGTLLAHVDGGCPNIVITLDKLSDYTFGEAVYFFWKSLAISAYMIDVNPFNQPGVEDYKKNMFALLGKPGYEDSQAELQERLRDIL